MTLGEVGEVGVAYVALGTVAVTPLFIRRTMRQAAVRRGVRFHSEMSRDEALTAIDALMLRSAIFRGLIVSPVVAFFWAVAAYAWWVLYKDPPRTRGVVIVALILTGVAAFPTLLLYAMGRSMNTPGAAFRERVASVLAGQSNELVWAYALSVKSTTFHLEFLDKQVLDVACSDEEAETLQALVATKTPKALIGIESGRRFRDFRKSQGL